MATVNKITWLASSTRPQLCYCSQLFGSPDLFIRHSIPNKIEMDSNVGVLVVFRCVDCQLLLDREVDEEQVICDPCKKLQKNILAQQNRKKRSSSALLKLY